MNDSGQSNPKVALFVTCLVDLFRPSVGFASVKLLEDAGCRVEVPVRQTCCGQPAWNSGDREDTQAIAMDVVKTFEPYDYVVAPSGSCAGMMRKHYGEVFAGNREWEERANRFGEKVHELTSFLVEVLGVTGVSAAVSANVTYHDSCAGLRELGVKSQPRQLVQSVEGLTLTEMKDSEVCCGFGGTFAVKYSEISNSIVAVKAENIEEAKPQMLLAGDMGCLLNMAGKLKRQNSAVEVRHVAEVLAGMVDHPPIGDRASSVGKSR